jgi:LmbE family N-acetylglucosaminyl deacetylase
VKLLVVSPHFDDAVLSVGAAMCARARAGTDVVVATVCTGVQKQSRVDEDANAAAIIGARTVHVGLADAPLRGIKPKELCEIDDDVAFAVEVADALRPLVQSADEVWGPLGVGRHVDHRATYSALVQLGCTTFYEDRPYARRRGAVGLRWHELGAKTVDVDRDDSDDSVHFARMFGMIPLRDIPMPRTVRLRGNTLRRLLVLVDKDMAEVRMRAIDAYVSQRRFLVGNPREGGWPFDDAAEALWSVDPQATPAAPVRRRTQ